MRLKIILYVLLLVLAFTAYAVLVREGVLPEQIPLKVVLLLAILGLSTAILSIYVRMPRGLALLKNAALSLYGFIFIFILLEIVFSFVVQSHTVSYTLASHNWFERHWKLNSLDYRDQEPDEGTTAKKVLVIGDSFTAGHGTDDPTDRYTDVLERQLGLGYEVYNLGMNGADTRQEYRALLNYPVQPDLLVLQYFGNDMDSLLSEHVHRPIYSPYKDLPRPLALAVINSHFLNYVYWQFPHSDMQPLMEYFINGYKDPEMLGLHLQDLGKFVNYSRENNVPLAVVIFPYLQDLEMSKVYAPAIRDFFAKHNVPVVDVTDLVKYMEPRARIANPNDSHPSKEVHEKVGKKLAEVIIRL